MKFVNKKDELKNWRICSTGILGLWLQLGPGLPLLSDVTVKHEVTWPHHLLMAIWVVPVVILTQDMWVVEMGSKGIQGKEYRDIAGNGEGPTRSNLGRAQDSPGKDSKGCLQVRRVNLVLGVRNIFEKFKELEKMQVGQEEWYISLYRNIFF